MSVILLNKNSLAIKSVGLIRSIIANGHKRPKLLISGKAKSYI